SGFAELTNIRQMQIQLFPNPNNGHFKIEYESALKPSHLQVVNLLGEVVYSKEVEGTESSLNLSLAKGVYFLRIIGEGKNLGTAKFIVE
ncbi:MAG: T9SS type A sorting domain-containing protein, partial [Bacteroidia bacterium]|nr:T9SS type A sorting domain-containing protein [Bacteroidia bacterium]